MINARKEGYYWVKVTEKTQDLGGPNSDEWVIEYWDGSEWLCFYADDDSAFSEIDGRRIVREGAL